MNSNNIKHVVGFCILGFIIRAGYVYFFNQNIIFPDEKRFLSEALSLLHQSTFFSGKEYAHDMPLTGFFFAGVMKITGESVLWLKFALVLVSSLNIYLIAILAHEIYPSRYSVIIAAAFSSCYPFFVFYSSLLLSETLFLFFVTTLFIILLRHRGIWGSGIVAGLAHLTRPTLLIFLPVVWLWSIVVNKSSWQQVLLAVLIFVLMILPWGIRNMHVLGQFNLSTSGSGQVLWEGNNPWNNSGSVAGDFSPQDDYLVDIPDDLDELATDNFKKSKAIDYIKANPGRFVDVAIKKFFRFWNIWPNSKDYQSWKYKLASLLSFAVVLVFSIFGLFKFRQDFRRLSPIYLFFAYYTAIHMITIGSIRYRLPLEPLLVALASAVIAKMVFADKPQHVTDIG